MVVFNLEPLAFIVDCLYQPEELVSEVNEVNKVTGTSLISPVLLGLKTSLIVSSPIIIDGFISIPKLLLISVFKIDWRDDIDGKNWAIFWAVVSEITPLGADIKLSVNSLYVTPKDSKVDVKPWIFEDISDAIELPMFWQPSATVNSFSNLRSSFAFVICSENKVEKGDITIFSAPLSFNEGNIIWYALVTMPKVESTALTGTSATIGLFFKHSYKVKLSVEISNLPSESVVADNSPSSLRKLKFWSIKIFAPLI